MIVAIDGTVCSGKSTIAKRLAKALGFTHINTGAIYRAMTVACIRVFGKDMDVESLTDDIIKIVKPLDIDESFDADGGFKITLNGEDITGEINLPYVSHQVSHVAKIPEIREMCKIIQKRIASCKNCVIEGRDIGTVVFPNAEVKFYMSADDIVRAKRRMKDYEEKGENYPIEEVLKEIRARDEEDMNRAISPLKPADDAIIIDNSGDDPDEMVDYLKRIVLSVNKE